MKHLVVLFSLLLMTGIMSCSQNSDLENNISEASPIHRVEIAGNAASYPQLMQMHNGQVHLWWIEKDAETKKDVVVLSRLEAGEKEFSERLVIKETTGVSSGNGESIPKLILKPDGTYVLVFSRPNENAAFRFASSVVYTQSFDGGVTWQEPKLIHSDNNPENGHSFPEAVLLPNGEVAAVWLDGRHKLGYSEMYFAKTNAREGFGTDKKIGGATCECCKNDMFVDSDNVLHITYRGQTSDDIRDIMYFTSPDLGETFSTPVRISTDDWEIKACPHNGPSITGNGNNRYYTWYTLGSGEGLFFTQSKDGGKTFGERITVSNHPSVKHPYVELLDGTPIVVWDESIRLEDRSYRRIKTATISEEGSVKTQFISPEGTDAGSPYIMRMANNDVLLTWDQQVEEGGTGIYIKHIRSKAKAEPVATL